MTGITSKVNAVDAKIPKIKTIIIAAAAPHNAVRIHCNCGEIIALIYTAHFRGVISFVFVGFIVAIPK